MVVWIVAAAVLAGLVWAFGPRALTYVVLLRVPLIALLLVLAGPWYFTGQGSELLWNLFVLDENVHLAWAITLSYVSTWVCLSTIRIYVLHGEERFGVAPPEFRFRFIDTLAQALLRLVPASKREAVRPLATWAVLGVALPLVPSALYVHRAELSGQDLFFGLVFALIWIPFLFGITGAIWLGLRKLVATSLGWPIGAWVRAKSRRWIGPWGQAGYVDEHGLLLEAHVGMTAVFGGFLFFYAWGYKGWYPSIEMAVLIPSTIGFLLMLAGMLTALLAGLTFFLDRFRIPLLAAVVLALWLADVWRDADHYYRVLPLEEQRGGTISLPSARESLFDWLGEKSEAPPIVVVCAEGGGIQSASWTAQALTGLHERYGGGFTDSVRLVSGVSGGSVGLFHYLSALQASRNELDANGCQAVREAANTSALAALGWGILYPDFLRIAAPWLPVDPIRDRSWALEEIFRARDPRIGKERKTRLSDWVEATRSGRLPAIVFNATFLETGGQLLFKTVSFGTLEEREREDPAVRPTDFFRLYPGMDVEAVTAARLSATFPYVTPAARARGPEDGVSDSIAPALHVVDGGYFDNAGVASAALWLWSCFSNREEGTASGRGPWQVDHEALDRVGRIYVVWLRAFPREAAEAEGAAEVGWSDAVLGPLQTLLNTRTSSQVFRNLREIEALQMLFASPEMTDKLRFVMLRPPAPDDPEAAAELPFSLSWHLTRRQIQRNADDWERLVANGGLEALDEEFGR